MTPTIRFARIALLAPLAILPTAARADDAVSYQLETSVASTYVNRGVVQYVDQRTASSQNLLAVRVDHVGPGAVTLTAWSEVALSAYAVQPGTAMELDISGVYAFPAGPLSLGLGYTAGLFPSHLRDTPLDGTHELTASASYDNAYVVPSAMLYAELVHQQGAYLSLGGSRALHAGPWTFSPAASVGCASYRKYGGGTQSAGPHLNDVTAVLGAQRELDGGFYAAARLSYSLRGTPSELMDMGASWGFDGRSSLFGVVAVGVAR